VGISEVLDQLSGLGIEDGTRDENASSLREITHPRFLTLGDDLLFECRVGIAGNGSCMLFRYVYVGGQWRWNILGRYLTGKNYSP
jgi:hypothetical protein